MSDRHLERSERPRRVRDFSPPRADRNDDLSKRRLNPTQRGLIALIRLYQRTLSPDHSWLAGRFPGGYCRFSPTCSQYALEAIEHHGAIRGTLLGINRIWRCNPWNPGGFDPVS